MLTRKFSQNLIGWAFIITGTQVFGDTSTGMKKDEWLSNLKTIAPSIICKGFFDDVSLKQRLEELKITQDKCLTLIPPAYDTCQAKYYSQLPETIDQSNGTKWGRAIGECIGADFMLNNMSPAAPAATDTTTPSTQNITPPPASSNETKTITKDQWLSDLKGSAPELICKGFLDDAYLKVKFQEKSIDMKQCIVLLPDSFDRCKAELYSQLPATLTSDDTSKWGYKIGECIGGDFVKKHILGDAKPQ